MANHVGNYFIVTLSLSGKHSMNACKKSLFPPPAPSDPCVKMPDETKRPFKKHYSTYFKYLQRPSGEIQLNESKVCPISLSEQVSHTDQAISLTFTSLRLNLLNMKTAFGCILALCATLAFAGRGVDVSGRCDQDPCAALHLLANST